MGALRPTGSRSYDPQLGPVSAVWSASEGRTQRDGRSNPRAAALVTRLHSSPLNSPLHGLGRLWPGPVNGWFRPSGIRSSGTPALASFRAKDSKASAILSAVTGD